MFNFKPKDMNLETRPLAKVYYTYNPDNKKFKLFESTSYLSSWNYVNEYNSLDEVQEAARSRAIRVIEMGLFKDGHRQGITAWFKEPAEIVTYPEKPAYLVEDDIKNSSINGELEIQTENKFIRKVKK